MAEVVLLKRTADSSASSSRVRPKRSSGRRKAAPDFQLSSAQGAAITEARTAFGSDYRYLEQILWSARARGVEASAGVAPA